jgi:hypothetical protein
MRLESEYPIPPYNPEADRHGGAAAFMLFISFILLWVIIEADKGHQKEHHQVLETEEAAP